METFKPLVIHISNTWKEKYHSILAEEHLQTMTDHIRKFQNNDQDWELPYFNEEIKPDRKESFNLFITIFQSYDSDEVKASQLEKIPFEHWLNILGQRLTSASIRDENAVPPLKITLLDACRKPFNSEITIAQRAWEKHIGRMDDQFWGEIKGNNEQKQRKVMEKISYILDNRTWWNVFYHYKHELVFEVREKEGHGIRWSHNGNQLIGFLEKFINE
ncbi:hypothetical protein ACM46_21590 [Chryseobacterium angstadtii]|uniref:Uncharacterized protein n=1 Tax=Chryseobacterium angstadtii TaxID=558151 RepID=A0A0J7HX08_9FLAO|nr:hypothetical protein [Chryseobacterium angstadtii]KMQ58617.1 hypothetical protein ACM46_21590 [Chryseobacterium angstadtii]